MAHDDGGSRHAYGPRRLAALAPLLRAGTEEHYLDPALYDLEYEDHRADIPWYLGVIGALGASPRVLELGAGTGRVTLPLALAGARMLALERMPPMLEALRARLGERPELDVRPIAGDILAIPLRSASVDAVIAPFNVLMHLYSHRELSRCFSEVFRVLVPGGRFALDVLLPDLEWLRLTPGDRHCITRFVHPTTGATMYYSTDHTYDPATQIAHIRLHYDDARPRRRAGRYPAATRTIQLAHRQIFPDELAGLLVHAGFDEPTLTADFGSDPITADAESICAVTRKAGPRPR